MIARVTIAAGALRPAAEGNTRHLRVTHERLTEVLAAHGVLVFADDPATNDFLDALVALGRRSPDAHKRWEVLISAWHGSTRLSRARPNPTRALDEIADLEALRSQWGGKAQVAIVSDEQAELLGVPDDEVFLTDASSGIELVRVEDADQTQLLRDLRDRAQRHTVEADTRREEIWKDILLPLVRGSKVVTIRDPYLGKSILVDGVGGHPPELVWLLDCIDGVARPGVTVRVLISVGPPGNGDRLPTVDEIAEALRRKWLGQRTGTAIGQVEIIGTTPPRYQRARPPRPVPHDRWILCDSDRAVDLPAGFDRLRRFRTRDPMTLTYCWRATDLRKHAAEIDQIQTHPTRCSAVIEGLQRVASPHVVYELGWGRLRAEREA